MSKLKAIKEILKIIISVFIVVGLVRSCANARTITGVEIANFILNGYGKYNNDIVEEQKIENVSARMSNWNYIADSLNEHEGNYFLGYSKELKQAFFAYFYGPSNSMLSENAFRIYNYSNLQSGYYFGKDSTSNTMVVNYYNVGNDTLNVFTWTNQNPTTTTTIPYTRLNDSFTTADNRFFYTDRKVRFNYWGSYFNAGTYSPNTTIFNENFISSTKWELIPNSSQQITIPNKTETYFTLNKGTFTTTLATLQDSVYTDQIMLTIQAYNGTRWQQVYDKELFNIENSFISDTFPSQTEGDIMKSQIQVKSNIIPNNVIVALRVYPNQYIANDLGLTELEQFYYITNAQTVINSNILDISKTFSGDTNYENEVNQAIENAQNNENSNNLQDITDQINENNNWWKTQFDNLFTMDSGEMQDSLEKFAEDNKFSSGELQIAMLGLDQLNSNSGDFIISWNSYTPHMSINGTAIEQNNMIPSGEVNFSKLERDYPRIHNIMIWERRIVGLALLLLLAHNLWKTLMHTLGIGMQVYDTEEEERERVSVTYDKNGKHVTTTKRVGNLTIRKVK